MLIGSMEFVTSTIGWIEMICGPMFSGKSEEPIRRLRRAMIARKRVQAFKPAIDTRYGLDEIVLHGDLRMESEVVNAGGDILERVDWRSEVVGVDEANPSPRRWPSACGAAIRPNTPSACAGPKI
jgi:thymidine kinase